MVSARPSLYLQSSFPVRRGGEWIQSPLSRVSLLPTMAWLGVCVSSMWHKAAGCTPELGKPLLLKGCSSLLFQEELYCASPQTCQKQ